LSPARDFSRTRECSSPSCHVSCSVLILERLGTISSQSTWRSSCWDMSMAIHQVRPLPGMPLVVV
jgi:hypothetical protein